MWGLGGIWANAGGISGAHLVCQLVQEIPAKLETYKVIFIIILTSFHFWGEISPHLNMRESMFLPIWESRNQSPVLVRFDNSYEQVWFGRFGLEGLVWKVWFGRFGLVLVLVCFDNSYDQLISRLPISACWDWDALFCLIIVCRSWLSLHQLLFHWVR